ncbi:hypothetical protein EVG20_g8082 [Dentipellis fragilis]|uniref:Uncharacterized protein n=1 Tax=Dentipellis fragilis TaxID=205917 RepID=A0A4Y9YAX6_9AGAM|nr:hypothetical protein EVG20_g8082 [Dentipellis fragilis]
MSCSLWNACGPANSITTAVILRSAKTELGIVAAAFKYGGYFISGRTREFSFTATVPTRSSASGPRREAQRQNTRTGKGNHNWTHLRVDSGVQNRNVAVADKVPVGRSARRLLRPSSHHLLRRSQSECGIVVAWHDAQCGRRLREHERTYSETAAGGRNTSRHAVREAPTLHRRGRFSAAFTHLDAAVSEPYTQDRHEPPDALTFLRALHNGTKPSETQSIGPSPRPPADYRLRDTDKCGQYTERGPMDIPECVPGRATHESIMAARVLDIWVGSTAGCEHEADALHTAAAHRRPGSRMRLFSGGADSAVCGEAHDFSKAEYVPNGNSMEFRRHALCTRSPQQSSQHLYNDPTGRRAITTGSNEIACTEKKIARTYHVAGTAHHTLPWRTTHPLARIPADRWHEAPTKS